MGVNRGEYGNEDVESLGSREGSNPWGKKRGKGGPRGTKGNAGGGSKSVLEGGSKTGREHLCWGPSCGADATRLAGLPNLDHKTKDKEPISFVPLCQSCAGKVKRKAQKKGLPDPHIAPMSRHVSELYKMQVDGPSATPDANVENFIKKNRAGSDKIFSMGEAKSRKQQPDGRWVNKRGMPNIGPHPVFKVVANERRKKERDELTVRASKGEFESLKEPEKRGKKK